MAFSEHTTAAHTRPDDGEVTDVCDRWRVRYQRAQLHEPVSACPAAPDVRSSYMLARAAFVAREGRLTAAPRVEDELQDTLLELAATRKENNELAEQNAELKLQVEAERKQRVAAEAATAHHDDLVGNLHDKVEALEEKLAAAQREKESRPRANSTSFYARHTSASSAQLNRKSSTVGSVGSDASGASNRPPRALRGASPIRPGMSPAANSAASTPTQRPAPRPVSAAGRSPMRARSPITARPAPASNSPSRTRAFH